MVANCPETRIRTALEQAGFRDVPCPVADRLWLEGLYLPSSPSLTKETIQTVADCIGKAKTGAR